MKKYRVWLEDEEPQSVEIEADSEADAREKVRRMLDDDTMWETVTPEFTQSSWEISGIEEAY